MGKPLESGKVPVDLLEKYVFTRTGAGDPAVVMGPSYGEDAAVVRLGEELVLVAHSDPITAATSLAGWLSVHVACNDIAVRGVKPRWLLPVLLLPEGSGEALLDEITRQIDGAAKEVGATIIGGHTEYAPGLDRPIISMTALGLAREGELVYTSGARPGDVVLMTKTAALEGTAILATDFRKELLSRGVDRRLIERAEGFIRGVSVVREALILAGAGIATAMHDPTEGGVLGGVSELAHASGVRIRVYEERIPVAPETRVLAQALGVDPLRLISSGVLIATVPGQRAEEALTILSNAGVQASIIGEVLEAPQEPGAELVRRDGGIEELPRQVIDEIYKLV